jgi:hypothetical protein
VADLVRDSIIGKPVEIRRSRATVTGCLLLALLSIYRNERRGHHFFLGEMGRLMRGEKPEARRPA